MQQHVLVGLFENFIELATFYHSNYANIFAIFGKAILNSTLWSWSWKFPPLCKHASCHRSIFSNVTAHRHISPQHFMIPASCVSSSVKSLCCLLLIIINRKSWPGGYKVRSAGQKAQSFNLFLRGAAVDQNAPAVSTACVASEINYNLAGGVCVCVYIYILRASERAGGRAHANKHPCYATLAVAAMLNLFLYLYLLGRILRHDKTIWARAHILNDACTSEKERLKILLF